VQKTGSPVYRAKHKGIKNEQSNRQIPGVGWQKESVFEKNSQNVSKKRRNKRK
jgi:hypothetical protein